MRKVGFFLSLSIPVLEGYCGKKGKALRYLPFLLTFIAFTANMFSNHVGRKMP